MQIGINMARESQYQNRNKMMEMYTLSDSLIRMIKVELGYSLN
jgi:hypothetical protein